MPKKKQGSLADVLRKYLLEIPGAYWKTKLQPALNPKGPLGAVVKRKKKRKKLEQALRKK